jgi:hypothetical protein
MKKFSATLLFSSLIVGMPTSSQAGPITLRYLNDSFATVVISLNRMRVFSNACGMSKTTEPIALEFMTNFSVKAGVSTADVNKLSKAHIPPHLKQTDLRELAIRTMWSFGPTRFGSRLNIWTKT